MWREVELDTTVRIAPMFVNSNIHNKIKEELHSKVEGQITRNGAMILGITSNEITASTGRVSQRTGWVLFQVKYKALVCAPQKDDIIDAEITTVPQDGIRAQAGPLELFIHRTQLPDGVVYDQESSTFRGPNLVFERDNAIRVKIISVSPNPEMTRITATATLRGRGLGILGTLGRGRQ